MSASDYESWFLSARDPAGRRGVWLRRTTLGGGGGVDQVASWCTTFDGPARTVKQVWDGGAPPDLVASASQFRGVAGTASAAARWDLAVEPAAGLVRPMRPALVYRLPVPRTKVEVPVPVGVAGGAVVFDGQEWSVDGWPVTVGHNWGSEHAEQWVWLHAFGVGPFAWLELVLARVRVAGRLTPWTATGAAEAGGHHWNLGGLGRPVRVRDAGPDGLDVDVAAPAGRLTVRVANDLAASTVVSYRDPGAGTRTVVHNGIAPTQLSLPASQGRTVTAEAVAAFEVGSSAGWPGVTAVELPLERP